LLFLALRGALAYLSVMGSTDLKKWGASLTIARTGSTVSLLLVLNSDASKSLASLFTTAAEGAVEVRVELPDFSDAEFPVPEQWSLYAKATTGSDRAMVAHPSEKEWVGSLLLSPGRLKKIAQGLSELAPGAEYDIESQGRFSYPSNLKLRFQRI
jgi:hypothetical protein